MGDFDPDAYLSKKDEGAFNPDAFLNEKQSPKSSTMEAAGRGALQGATYGFSDELAGVRAAGSSVPDFVQVGPIPVPARTLTGAARLAKDYFTGDNSGAYDAYEHERDAQRAAQHEAKSEHPWAYGAGEIAGAIPAMAAIPEAGVVKGAGLLASIGRSAITGAEYGALSGAGEGTDVGSRASGATAGAIGGAGAGALGPVAGKVAEYAANKFVKPVVNTVRGWMDPEAEAARRVGAALKRDSEMIQAGTVKGLTPQEWIAARNAGEPVTLADLGAGNTQALLRSAANTSPEGRAMLEQVIENRFLSQSERVADTVRGLVPGGANAGKTAEDLVDAYNKGRQPLYKMAYQQGDREIISPEMERLMGSPAFEQAMKNAVQSGKDRAVSEGYGAFNPGVTVENGIIKFTKTKPNGVPQYPNLQYWDAVKKELDSMASVANRQGDTSSVAGNLASKLRDELDKQVPSYANARGFAANFFGENNALEAGRGLAGKKVDPQLIRDAMGKMKPDERELFREGYASDWANRVISNMSQTRDITKAMFNSPNERARAEAVFGPAGMAKIQARMTLETIMDGARRAMGNSTTARQLIEAGLAGGALEGYVSGWDPTHIAAGALTGAGARKALGAEMAAGARQFIGRVDARTARNVAEMLTSDDPRKLVQGLNLAMSNQRIMDGLKKVANALSLSLAPSGREAAVKTVPSIQGAVGASADQEKPNSERKINGQPNRSESERSHKAHGGPIRLATGGAANHNHTPSEAQQKAGNYAKTHKWFHGLDISIENLKGSKRSGVSKTGKAWSVKMPAHYGYIKGTTGADKDHVDCYLGPNERSDQVFVVDQMDDKTGRFDEHKCLLGFNSEKEAKATYLAGFSDGKNRIKHMRRMTINEFKDWLKRGDTDRPVKAQDVGLRIAYRVKGNR